MKFTFFINQAGISRYGLVGRVDLAAWCLLDYLCGWHRFKNAKRAVVDGKQFTWLQYEHAVEELPLLFNPAAGIATRKNQLTRLVQNLRDAGLVESVKVGRDLYLRPSDLAAAINNSRERVVTKLTPTLTPGRDDTVMPPDDGTITPVGDDSHPTIIDETTISKTTIMKQLPHNPPKGECLNGDINSIDHSIEEIYAAYPKKVAKPAALRAIRRALKDHAPEFLLDRTKVFATTYTGDPQFIPYPATWFNNHRFNDDPATWRGNFNASNKPQPTIVRHDEFGCGVSKL